MRRAGPSPEFFRWLSEDPRITDRGLTFLYDDIHLFGMRYGWQPSEVYALPPHVRLRMRIRIKKMDDEGKNDPLRPGSAG